jgi:hypothetical protein
VTESAALVRSDVTVTAAPVVVSESIVAAAACVVAVPTPTATPTPVATVAPVVKKTITCVKGKKSVKKTAISPKCPAGYKLKK